MTLLPTKKRKLSSPSGQYSDKIYAQDTADDLLQDSPHQESKNVRGNGPFRGHPATIEAGTKTTTPWGSGIYDSSMFKLKAVELLEKVRPDYERRMVKVESSLRKLKDIIERIPDREAKPVCSSAFVLIWLVECLTFAQVLEAERQQLDFHNVRIPFPQPRPPKDAKYTLAYSKPANINVVGSYARKTAIQLGERLEIDLAVTMPSVRPLLCPILARSLILMPTKAHVSRERLSEL